MHEQDRRSEGKTTRPRHGCGSTGGNGIKAHGPCRRRRHHSNCPATCDQHGAGTKGISAIADAAPRYGAGGRPGADQVQLVGAGQCDDKFIIAAAEALNVCFAQDQFLRANQADCFEIREPVQRQRCAEIENPRPLRQDQSIEAASAIEEREGIIAQSHFVVAGPAVGIVRTLSDKYVIARFAIEAVSPAAALQRVIAKAAHQQVFAGIAIDRVVA